MRAITVRILKLFRTAIAAACLCTTSVALADRAAADATPPQQSKPLALRVAEDPDARVHRIVIPQAVLADLAGDVPIATIASASTIRSMVAAVALSAAVACGLVAFRRGRPGRLAAVVLCGLSVAGAGHLLVGGTALADVAVPDGPGVPGGPRRPRPRPFVDGPESVTLAQGGRVILEIGEVGGDAVVLVVGTRAGEKH